MALRKQPNLPASLYIRYGQKKTIYAGEYFTKFFSNNFKATEEISNEYNRNGDEVTFVNSLTGIVEGNFLKRAWGIRKDITLQKKSEEALAESEYRLRAIIQTDPECIKLLSREGTILEMNPAGLAMIEAENPEQVIGKNVFSIILPEYKKAVEKLVKDVFEGRQEKLIFRIKGLKGRELWMETHCVPFRNAAGEITAMLSVTRDITESKLAQAQLLKSEEQYKYLFNNNPASIIIWDLDTLQILEVNETAVELYGYSKEEFLELTVLNIRPKDEQARLLELVEEVKKTDFCKKIMRWRHITSSGNSIIMTIASHSIQYNGKRAVLSLGNNITEKVQLENSLNEERKIRHQQITEAVITGQEKERTQLGEELHDNINQILASTKLYLECSLKDENPRVDLVTESKLLIEKAMTEIRKLSKSLLPPSLGEVGLLQALNELADNIKQVNELSISIQWKDVCENELSNKLKLTIFRIVQEQLNNVIKHADAKEVLISLSKDGNALQVIVKDNGVGFEPDLKRNGVGLRNITSRAEVNNGIVFINSKPGEGCELIVNFSLEKALKTA
ncbi:MAG: PAS domain S-box protein [Chitinophagaceae bacterium]|nr:PAS domain S-box protein [Chitinophagaceae bacterium]